MRDREEEPGGHAAGQGRLRARPSAAPGTPWDGPTGEATTLNLTGGKRDALLYVPAGYQSDQPMPLALMLHGAGGNASHGLRLLADEADASGLLLLAPSSRQGTWDAVLGQFGPDVTVIDRTLAHVFDRFTVNPERLAIGGFSDGGSYALSLGINNGDLFSHIVALSPGFSAHTSRHGRPRIFVSHGTRDETLPISVCSRRIVPALRHAGYDVTYQEFDGPHTVPPRIAHEAAEWFTQKGSPD